MSQMKLDPLESDVLEKINPDEIVALLQTLIQKRSDYPPGDTRAAIQVIVELLQNENIQHLVLAKHRLQKNLLATYPSNGQGKRLLFHAHIDTVPAGELAEWTKSPFAGEIEAGRVYGRGAGDDKASVAVQVMALIALARAGVSLDGCLQVAIVADEESGAIRGTRWLRDTGQLQPDFLVVGEQTNNQVAIAERVACGIDLTVFGKSAHGAMPWAGENAILKAARVIAWLEENYFPQLLAKKMPYLAPPTLNFGRIQGGVQWNMVAGQCKIEMDRRLIPGETREMAMQELQSLLDEYGRTVEPLHYKLFSTGKVASNINTSPDEPFVQVAIETLNDISTEKRALTGYQQTSDGRWFADDGIPIIIFGPGDPAVGHAADEYVEINQLIEATRFLALFAMRWLQRNDQEKNNAK